MSKRHPSSGRRPASSTTDSSDDAFVAGVLTFSEWAKKNQTTLVIFGVVLAVVIFGVTSYSNTRARQLQDAGLELEQIQQTLAIGDPEAAKVGLTQYLERFGNTPYAGEAALILGSLYLESDQPELALRSLERVDLSLRDPLGPQAFVLRGRALESSGRLSEAEDTYLDVANGATMGFEERSARADAARMREAQGDFAGAAALYEEILEGLEVNDPDRGLYEMRLEEARTRA